MAKTRFMVEQIIIKLREAVVALAQGRTGVQVCNQIGVTEQTYDRWRKEYGGIRMFPFKLSKYYGRSAFRVALQYLSANRFRDLQASYRAVSRLCPRQSNCIQLQPI